MLDSTIIPLCLKVFDWARYRKEKGAIKLHVLLDCDGCMRKYLFITEGRQADIKHAKYMSLPPNSVLVIDRGYIDFHLLNQWSQENIFFCYNDKGFNKVYNSRREAITGGEMGKYFER